MTHEVDDPLRVRQVEVVGEPRPDAARAAGLALGGELVDRGIGHRADEIGDRLGEGPDRGPRGLAGLEVAVEDAEDHEHELADPFGRDERSRRREHHEGDQGQRVGRPAGHRDETGDRLGRRRQDDPAADDRVDLDEAVDEAGHDADVAASAADRPEQVGMALLVDRQDPAVGGNDLGATRVVDRHPVLAGQEADPAAGRDAADPDAGRVAERDGEAMGGRSGRDLAGGQAGLRPRRDAARGR